MALLTSEYEERRLLDIANGYRNGYRDDAVRVEALLPGEVGEICSTQTNGSVMSLSGT